MDVIHHHEKARRNENNFCEPVPDKEEGWQMRPVYSIYMKYVIFQNKNKQNANVGVCALMYL